MVRVIEGKMVALSIDRLELLRVVIFGVYKTHKFNHVLAILMSTAHADNKGGLDPNILQG